MNVKNEIENFYEDAKKEVDEGKIIIESERLLEQMRTRWTENRASFATEDVEALQNLKHVAKSLKGFKEEQEEFKYIRYKQEVDDSIGRLYDVVEVVDGYKVSGRVHKEIRELLEKKTTLPNEEVGRKSIELLRAINSLAEKASTCVKCGNAMVLREGYGYFWGCSTFPACWQKNKLTTEQKASLPP